MNKSMVLILGVALLGTPPAWAQGTSSGTSAQPGSISSGSMSDPSMTGSILQSQQPNQYLSSNLTGTTVVSANGDTIGDINDIVIDRSGQIAAVVVGVGGFLGIGEKNVAVPFRALEINQNNSGMTTGSAAQPSSTISNATGRNQIVLKMSKADLQSAPAFQTLDRTYSGTSGSTNSNRGTGNSNQQNMGSGTGR